jgi:hypothetical protein
LAVDEGKKETSNTGLAKSREASKHAKTSSRRRIKTTTQLLSREGVGNKETEIEGGGLKLNSKMADEGFRDEKSPG